MGRGCGRGRCRGCGLCRLLIVVSIVFVVYSSIYVVVCMMSLLLPMLLSMPSSKRWGREVVQAIDHRAHQIGICRQSKQRQEGIVSRKHQIGIHRCVSIYCHRHHRRRRGRRIEAEPLPGPKAPLAHWVRLGAPWTSQERTASNWMSTAFDQ